MTQAHYSGRSASGSTMQPGVIPFLFRKREGDQLLSGIRKSYDRAMEASRAESRLEYENKYSI
jgi:hypothetical protein